MRDVVLGRPCRGIDSRRADWRGRDARGRGGSKAQHIVVHYNAAGGTTEDPWGWWQTRPASAHYQVESSGRIGQLVWDRDTAWHAAVQRRVNELLG